MKSYNLYNDGFDNYRMKEEIDGDYIKTADFKKVIEFIKKDFIRCDIKYENCDCDINKLCRYLSKIGV